MYDCMSHNLEDKTTDASAWQQWEGKAQSTEDFTMLKLFSPTGQYWICVTMCLPKPMNCTSTERPEGGAQRSNIDQHAWESDFHLRNSKKAKATKPTLM